MTAKQKRFIAALLQAPSIAAAANVAGIGERTAYRWLRDPAFRSELGQASDGLLSAALVRVSDMLGLALDAIEGGLHSVKPSIRLRAAAELRQYVGLRELADLSDRIAILEQRGGDNGEAT